MPPDVPRAPVVLVAVGAAGGVPGSIEDWMVEEALGIRRPRAQTPDPAEAESGTDDTAPGSSEAS